MGARRHERRGNIEYACMCTSVSFVICGFPGTVATVCREVIGRRKAEFPSRPKKCGGEFTRNAPRPEVTEGCTREGYSMRSVNIAAGGVLRVKFPSSRIVHTSSTSVLVGSLSPLCSETRCVENQACFAKHPAAHPYELSTPTYGYFFKFVGDGSFTHRRLFLMAMCICFLGALCVNCKTDGSGREKGVTVVRYVQEISHKARSMLGRPQAEVSRATRRPATFNHASQQPDARQDHIWAGGDVVSFFCSRAAR